MGRPPTRLNPRPDDRDHGEPVSTAPEPNHARTTRRARTAHTIHRAAASRTKGRARPVTRRSSLVRTVPAMEAPKELVRFGPETDHLLCTRQRHLRFRP